MKNLLLLLPFLFSQYAFCLNQTSLNILGQQYVVTEVDGMYYVNKQVEFKTLHLSTEDMKWSKSCDQITSLIKKTSEGLAHCQKGEINSDFVSLCKSMKFGVRGLIWGSSIESDMSMGIAKWSIENSVTSDLSENALVEKVASLINVKKSRITIQNSRPSTTETIEWKYTPLKTNPDFELLKNFYLYADEYTTIIEPYSGGLKTFDNLTRCSLLQHEAELNAEVEYKTVIPGSIGENTQNNIEDLFIAFRDVKIESLGNVIQKLLVVGAYIGYSFQQDLDYRDGNIFKMISAIYSSLFDSEFHLKKSIDLNSYRKMMNIQPIEITISGKLRAVAPE